MKKHLFIASLLWLPIVLNAQNTFQNSLGIAPPLPGLAVIEYERFLSDFSMQPAWSVGISTGFGYDAGKFKLGFAKGIEDLFETPVSFKVKWDYVFNPFVRYYFGKPEKKFRPALMLKPSLVFLNIENSKTHFYPAYEVHIMGNYSFNAQWFLNVSLGFKHFLKYEKIEYNGEMTYFPSFKFRPETEQEGKRWLPATDIVFGYRF